MGAKGTKKSKKQYKVLILGVSGSGKTTFIKQMKIIHHGGFTQEEVEQYKTIMRQNVLVGMQELVKQCSKMEVALEEKNRKFARTIAGVTLAELVWDEQMHRVITKLWQDKGVQEVWGDASHHQFQVNHMDYLMENIDRFSRQNFVPTNEDILLARQRTTGAYRTVLRKDKCRWELIDVGGQSPERRKWEEVLHEGLTAVIFFAGLDEYNMTSAEDKSKTKMDVARSTFAEVANSPLTKGVTKLLFLNKLDLFVKKMEDQGQFLEFQKTFPDYKGDHSVDQATEFIAKKFRETLPDDADQMHHHVVCALDTSAMQTVFEAVTEDIFMRKMDDMNAATTL